MMEGMHELGDAGGKVPPVEIKKVDIAGLEFLQAGFKRDLERFGMVALVICFDALWAKREGRGEFGSEDDFIAVATLGHPFAEPDFGRFTLVIVGGVDEVAAVRVKVVEDFERGLLVAFAHEAFPGIAKVHGTKAERGNSNTGGGGEDTVIAQGRFGLGKWLEGHLVEDFGGL